MFMPLVMWSAVALVYGVFLLWYLPLWRRTSHDETERVMAAVEAHGLDPARMRELRRFFEEDRGDSFVMANLMRFTEPKEDARRAMAVYERRFIGRLLGMAGFPLYAGRALLTMNVEQWGVDSDGWQAVALVRYRCRRDLARMVLYSLQGDTREYKHAALLHTFAFPVSTVVTTGGPCVLVGLVLALAAALMQIFLA